MASFALNISPDDLAKLKDLPREIATLAQSAQQSLAAVRSGADSGNPVGALLAGLGTLADEAQKLPAIDALVDPIRHLVGQLPTSALGDVKAIGAEIDALLGLFGPLKDSLLTGSIDHDLTAYIEKTLGEVGTLFKPSSEVTFLLGELEQFLKLFDAMLGWRDRAPEADEVVALIAHGLAGMSPDLLSGATAALDAVLKPLGHVVPDGPALTRWQNAAADRLALWQDIKARVAGSVSWLDLEARLHAELAQLIELKAVRDNLLQASIGNLARIDLRGVAGVATHVSAVKKPNDFRLTPILSGLRRQLESTATQIEAFAPTEEDVSKIVRGLVDDLVHYVENSPIGQLRALLVNFQQRILNAIESLPFRDLANDVDKVLRNLAFAIQLVDPDLIKRPVHEFFTAIETKLDSFSDNAVLDSVGKLWSGVGDALSEIGAKVQALRQTLEGLTTQLQGLAQNAAPALRSITDAVAEIDVVLANFDLSQPAQVVVGQLNDLRDKIEAVDVSSLPDAAISGLKAGAELLRKIDIAGTINPPLNDALAKVDPSALIQVAADKIGAITAQLATLDPAALTRDLDAPVDALLSEFSKIGPAQFTALLNDALKPIEDALRGLDFTALLAPITQVYAELLAKVDSVLNPDAIFAPLEALFKPVVDVIDALQPSRFISLLAPHSDNLVAQVGGAMGPPSAIGSASLKGAIPAGPEADDELFGFRIGDMLVPLIDLHRHLTQAFERLDSNVLSSAANTLQRALHGSVSSLHPAAVAAQVDSILQTTTQTFSPGVLSVQFGESVLAFHDAAGAVAAAARQAMSPADSAAAVRVLPLLAEMNPLVLLPDAVQFQGLSNAALHVTASLDVSTLNAVLPTLAHIDNLLPDFLRLPQLSADAIRQALHDVDPAPLRIEINTLFDRIGKRIVALQHIVAAAFEELGRIAEEFFLPVTPSALAHVADALHGALKAELLELSPARFKADVTLIFDVVKRQIGAFDPSIIVAELNGLRDALIVKLHNMVDALLPAPAPFHALQDQLGQLKPSQLLAPLVQTLKPVSDLAAGLDPKKLFQPLNDAIARIRQELPGVVADIEAALDEVLAAFPDGGATELSGSVAVG